MFRHTHEIQWGGDSEEPDQTLVWPSNEEEDAEESNSEPHPLISNQPYEDLHPEFTSQLLHVKHLIYQETVLKPEEDTMKAQDNTLLDLYQGYLQLFHQFTKKAEKNGVISNASLMLFPAPVVEPLRVFLLWVVRFFLKNTPRETIPYSHYMDTHLRTHPFFQDDLFIRNQNRK